jgi:hypothetical protein
MAEDISHANSEIVDQEVTQTLDLEELPELLSWRSRQMSS